MKIAILGSYSTQFLVKELKNLFDDIKFYESDYSQIDYEIWVDNVKVYGRQVASNYGLGRVSRKSMPQSLPVTPPIKN